MIASKALGLAGLILVFALGYLAYSAFQINFFNIQDFFHDPAFDEDLKILAALAIAVALLFLAIPGLVLMWMSEIGHELERVKFANNQTRHAVEKLHETHKSQTDI